ncbi:MAG: enoyl-CoA hydratase/isomerase family protein [Betaproteobacteria bacterium]|nr:enoyl-CoA hydratase/isomerase family protein [Betaproteobacteria bacterium]
MMPPTFDEYRQKYPSVQMLRRDGILQLTLHTGGDSLAWGASTKTELTYMLADVGNDPENRVIILTGTGDRFIRPGFADKPAGTPASTFNPERWGSRNHPEGKKLLMNHLDIPVPMIAAVNGPATMHGEIALLCDIVLAAEGAAFQDALHFRKGVLPGDGAHIVWPMLLGINRARYFLLTGQSIPAEEALRLGLVSEVLPRERLLPRAWELAEDIAQRPTLAVRLFRETLLQPYKRALVNDLGYGLALEGLSAAAYWPF